MILLLSRSLVSQPPMKVFEEEVPSNKDLRFSGKLIEEAIKETSKKYPVYVIGTGTGGKCLHFSIEYVINEPITQDQARAFLFEARNIVINTFNKKKSLNKYYSKHDYNETSFSITMFIKDHKENRLYHPQISVACIHSSGVYFRTNDPENEYKYKETFKETLEEAETKSREYLVKLKANQEPES